MTPETGDETGDETMRPSEYNLLNCVQGEFISTYWYYGYVVECMVVPAECGT